jgi:sec-independent protein translocase protein TatB
MPSFSDSIFLFALALLLFGPKRLPVLARELGKWVGEFRRASNEFKMQMEEELRLSEQADRQKQIAAIEAAAPIAPPLDEPVHPHLPAPETSSTEATGEITTASYTTTESAFETSRETNVETNSATYPEPVAEPAQRTAPETIDGVPVLPIATSGELRMMPPSTGLPTPQRSSSYATSNPLGGLLEAIPEASEAPGTRTPTEEAATQEPAAHGH